MTIISNIFETKHLKMANEVSTTPMFSGSSNTMKTFLMYSGLFITLNYAN